LGAKQVVDLFRLVRNRPNGITLPEIGQQFGMDAKRIENLVRYVNHPVKFEGGADQTGPAFGIWMDKPLPKK
jgi:hypothetical protein